MDRQRFYKPNKKGFTLIEVLLSLTILLIIVLNSATVISVIKSNSKAKTYNSNLEISIKSLSQIIVDAHNIEYGSELIYKNHQNEECKIYLDKNRIIASPGTNIITHDIDSIIFFKENNLIYITLVKEEREYTFLIGSDYEDETNTEEPTG